MDWASNDYTKVYADTFFTPDYGGITLNNKQKKMPLKNYRPLPSTDSYYPQGINQESITMQHLKFMLLIIIVVLLTMSIISTRQLSRNIENSIRFNNRLF
jgi:hypothetical protein